MIAKIIEFSIRNRFLVLLTAMLIGGRPGGMTLLEAKPQVSGR